MQGKADIACLTDMCTGVLVAASLHKVSGDGDAEPPQVRIEKTTQSDLKQPKDSMWEPAFPLRCCSVFVGIGVKSAQRVGGKKVERYSPQVWIQRKKPTKAPRRTPAVNAPKAQGRRGRFVHDAAGKDYNWLLH